MSMPFDPFADPDRFDFDELFEHDYLRYYAYYLTDEQTLEDAQLIAQLLELRPDNDVLDVACGHGRITNELAKLGLRVTGLDRSRPFLDVARSDAAELGVDVDVDVDFRHGDMRSLPWTGEFDRALCWFTSFGYFGDDDNRKVLGEVFRALRSGGLFLLDTMNLHAVLVGGDDHMVKRAGDDFMIDERVYDPETGRLFFRRTVIEGAERRERRFFVRLLTFTELRDWLERAGFRDVRGYGGEGEPFDVVSDRMIVVARKP